MNIMDAIYKKRSVRFFVKKAFFCTLIPLIAMKTMASAPDWSVDPSQFNYQMTYVGAVFIDAAQPTGPGNLIGAFVNNQCRGLATASYNANTGYWTYFITAYGNANGDSVKFRYYSSAKDTLYNFVQSSVFKADANYGSVFEPFTWSWPVLQGADIKSFTLPGQLGSQIFENSIHVIMPNGVDLSALKATYNASAGSVVKIGDIVQQSGKSVNDFMTPLTYTVRSSEGSLTRNYTVKAVQYSMKIVATCYVDSVESASAEDTLYAYMNGQLREKVTSVLNPEINARRFAFTLYNSFDTGTISFTFYAHVQAKVIDLNQTVHFNDQSIKGSQFNPLKLSSPVLKGKSLITFAIPNQIGTTYYKGSEIRVIVAPGNEMSLFSPVFTISAGAYCTVNDSVQYSGISKLMFPQAMVYTVWNSDRSDYQSYTVRVNTYNERLIASVYVDSVRISDPKDTLYAYTNGFLLGKTRPVYIDSLQQYRFDLRIYSHTGSSTIDFKYFIHATGQTISLPRTLAFNNSFEIGTFNEPVVLCSPELKQAELLSFGLPGQIGPTWYADNVLRIITVKGTTLHGIVPSFQTTKGSIVKINNAVVYSEISKVNFSNVTKVTVFSSDELVQKDYTLHIVDLAMNITATVFIDGVETHSVMDTLYAYTNGFILGKVAPVYFNDIEKYRFSMELYSHTPESDIQFSYYQASGANMIELSNGLPFESSAIKGTISLPVVLSNPLLTGHRFITFVLPGQVSTTIFESDTIKVIMPRGSSVSSILPTFTASPGSMVVVNGSGQYSGITAQNFETSLMYTVYSSTMADSTLYKVYVIQNMLEQISAPLLISPNGDGINDEWTIQDYEKLRDSRVYILNSLGTTVFESDGYNTRWDGTNGGSLLPMGVYYYVIKSLDGIVAKGSITLLR